MTQEEITDRKISRLELGQTRNGMMYGGFRKIKFREPASVAQAREVALAFSSLMENPLKCYVVETYSKEMNNV